MSYHPGRGWRLPPDVPRCGRDLADGGRRAPGSGVSSTAARFVTAAAVTKVLADDARPKQDLNEGSGRHTRRPEGVSVYQFPDTSPPRTSSSTSPTRGQPPAHRTGFPQDGVREGAQGGVHDAEPARTAGRITEVDALRGLALLGILVVNIAFFASGYPSHLVADPRHDSWVDQSLAWLVEALFTMKAYLLFSFLFGYSFILQTSSARRRAVEFRPRFLRRLAGLFVIGALHTVFLFYGDILTTYAVLGLVLFAMRDVPQRCDRNRSSS